MYKIFHIDTKEVMAFGFDSERNAYEYFSEMGLNAWFYRVERVS